ncbi:hypothetical protein N7520_009590 [Penicillium odoratum]|uniref:uncharacterized protein n=1 Tax=Penicillium odoratum TaxID=1167516 RepID=UPI0025488949|nr:uncharacterized protein N7520_009590 [Penicillium odoratum]KAJ5752673.1 hypothetical protein N7520_009590 [Penicillium odoratum]
MPVHEFLYFSSPDTCNWLDVFSRNKSFIDPRTDEVHQTAWTRYYARWNSMLACSRLEKLGRRQHKAFVQNWVHYRYGDIETEDVDSDYSDLEELRKFCSRLQHPVQLEHVPPFPKHRVCDDTLSGAYMQICRQDGYNELVERSSHEISDGEPCQPSSDATTIVVSSLSRTATISANEEVNIGKLIASKFRDAVVHGQEAYRSLRDRARG